MADKKITDYDAAASLALTDLIEAVVDPSGSPVSKKATFQQVATVVGTDTDLADAISKKHSQNTDTGTDQTSFTIDSGGSIVKKAATKTNASISKTIGSGGDYLTHAAAIADVPDLLANNVTHTIKAGTTLTETCSILSKYGSGSTVAYTLRAEKYFPTSGNIPTADSATSTTLVDSALASASLGDDYFNGCWIFIVDGTGTDNGFVAITDYTDSTGTVTVASWPGTQPDATSRYIIVGALIDSSGKWQALKVLSCYVPVNIYGIGMKGGSLGANPVKTESITISYCGFYGFLYSGVYIERSTELILTKSGIVKNNTSNNANNAGVTCMSLQKGYISQCGISDNNRRGILISEGGFTEASDNFGDGNGTYGAYAILSGQVYCTGTECSGSSGNHSNGTGDGSLAY